jgi:hypothetical protein
MGISVAVSGLNTTISGEEADQLMTALGQVTGGLATAFDTTLIALVMAILLLFPTESLRKREYEMLNRIEAFANEVVLRRMSDDRYAQAMENMPDVVRYALEAAFKEHQRWLSQWQTQVGQLGEKVGHDFEAVLRRLSDQASQSDAQRLEKYDNLSHVLEDIFEKAKQCTDQQSQLFNAPVAEEPGVSLSDLIGRMDRLIEKLDQDKTSRVPETRRMDVIEPDDDGSQRLR